MSKRFAIGFLFVAIGFAVYSYGFIDPHLIFFPTLGAVRPLRAALVGLVYGHAAVAATLYAGFILTAYWWYGKTFGGSASFPRWIVGLTLAAFLLSYPALSYDIYSYIVTAKVAFTYRENPYVVKPVELTNEPMLAYTRAANKLALYGPTWIGMTALPYGLGRGSPFTLVLAFKGFAALWYGILLLAVYRITGRREQVLFLALNPLVLIETFSSGHNDTAMMALALWGLMFWKRHGIFRSLTGFLIVFASVFVKGATVVLLPLLPMFRRAKWKTVGIVGCAALFLVFLTSPIREEMYPWYAIWWLSFAAIVPMGKRGTLIHTFSFWMSLGLMLRYIPWIATREYGGITPVARIILTALPVVFWAVKEGPRFVKDHGGGFLSRKATA